MQLHVHIWRNRHSHQNDSMCHLHHAKFQLHKRNANKYAITRYMHSNRGMTINLQLHATMQLHMKNNKNIAIKRATVRLPMKEK